ncbi:midasin [Xylariaceae sp. FL1272]|nr:midasin [Xylariaceae sp. FL1272]
MASFVDLSLQRAQLLDDALVLAQLPPDLLLLIRDHTTANFLDALAAAALIPQVSNSIFIYFEHVFADICARWLRGARQHGQEDSVIAAFARILPFAPHLSVYLNRYISETSSAHTDPPHSFTLTSLNAPNTIHCSEKSLLTALLAFWRLLNFEKSTYARLVRPSQVQALFAHDSLLVRYLAIKVFCCHMSSSDLKEEELLQKHVNHVSADPPILQGDFDGTIIDYAFLSLFEHKRAVDMDKLRIKSQADNAKRPATNGLHPQQLTDLVIQYGNVVFPRPNGLPASETTLIHTPTTLANLERLALNLQYPGPILLQGLPGSGKTSAVHELARELGMESSMVTLHLNEQTDAKMLVGLYSTDSKPGSFSWRPGVLTTAIREGRWVLIEDLDRAPNEVMSMLLPLIEHGKLLIPSRGETIEASGTFRLFATMRTTRGMHGQEHTPSFLGQRFWRLSSMGMPSYAELEQIVVGSYPLLRKYTAIIMSVYKRLCAAPNGLSMTGPRRNTADRPITPRDLLKWCRRLKDILVAAGCKTGEEPINDTIQNWMFMEATDCFCGSIASQDTRVSLAGCIAEEMHLPKQLLEHYLSAHVPHLHDSPGSLRVGRVMLTKNRHANRIAKSKRPFASTSHAKRLLEQIAVAVKLREPVLLVGETGIGKTTVVQQLAETLGHKLVAVNLSQQSEVGDLLGGFKPVNARSLAVPLKEEFEDLFAATGISAARNQKYLEQIGKCTAKGQWSKVLKYWREAIKMFHMMLEERRARIERENGGSDERPAIKRRKTESKLQSLLELQPRWDLFAKKLDQFDIQISGGSGNFAFAFVEGNIVKAARNGDWVLLDEINLASPDTLESIADLLASGPNDEPSILLSETGEIERVKAHPDFRIFGAMNPATDVGKRDLPLGLRSRFTELYVGSPDRDLKDLLTIIKAYLTGKSAKDDQAADDIARLYLNTKMRAQEKRLVDGANEVPHFSLRTLTRVLSYVNDVSPLYGLRRALFEGFSMGFLTLLDRASEDTLVPLIHHHLLERYGNPRTLLSQTPRHPNDGKQHVKFTNRDRDRHYWLLQGGEIPIERVDYIITPYVERNLLNLVRATSTRRFPILIQGPTSAGKTSMIEYLANFSGNKFVRINNHEHTDLQEYLGTYVSDATGKLKFQEGLLVQALREGHWIVLDELNLAPTDVLEALNRLLDDNRELLIPETQEIVRPHQNFMLFATQNPPGLYGGRKVLSRAFRNRFLELHFDDIPEDELETILQKRSLYTAPSDCKRIVNVYKELSRLRQTSRLFENKDSFATLRDLFRWALRNAESREEIAANGFMLLAERVRNQEERLAVRKVIENVFKVKIDEDLLYDVKHSPYLRTQTPQNCQGVVWTRAMRRLYVLVASALRNDEPVLLVGETGCGKTTVCQLLAEAMAKEIHIVNAHQNTETGDLIGSQRPIRNRAAIIDGLTKDVVQALEKLQKSIDGELDELLVAYHALDQASLEKVPGQLRHRISENEIKSKALFEWADGSLVHAMRNGQYFLLDEISLADDSVLERLNSVLEPQRSLLLAEKGIDNSFVKAASDFQFLATMNPGGDFGKKELSPALRNRFTEIWVPSLSGNEDVLQIVSSKLKPQYQQYARAIVEFSYWFSGNFRSTTSTAFSIRDILVWVKFINESRNSDAAFSVIHGAATVFIDTLGANPSALIAIDGKSMDAQKQRCLDKLSELLACDATSIYRAPLQLAVNPKELRIGDFAIGRDANESFDSGFALNAPTTKMNAMRVIRALQVQKPILLEGSPGVGKTTLVGALARACGKPLTRINLSDQTDLMDLFGTDVPVEGAEAGHFAWRDAPFLRAMQNGEWVLLDEMNLASQSVLEGLNACLDHRGEVYISELDQVFKRHPNFRLFAAQNPHHQGGGRKGLPSSFVNRFIVVYADVFRDEDLILIAKHNFPDVPSETVGQMINFIANLEERILVEKSFGSQGSPWEFNLRDTLRWLYLLTSSDPILSTGTVDDFLPIAIRQRFRSERDRSEVDRLFREVFGFLPKPHQLYHDISALAFQTGLASMSRNHLIRPTAFPGIDVLSRLPELESLLISIKQNIPCIMVGPSGCGKSVLLQQIAALAGRTLVTFPMNADIDAMDLVGGFEQSDPLREVNFAVRRLALSLQTTALGALPQAIPTIALDLLSAVESSNHETTNHKHLLPLISELRTQIAPDSSLAPILAETEELLQRPTSVEIPRFEWLDGIIVQALQNGEWLVLDNANLCSASVLDRLNSLLEPDGFLVINEHCGPGGEPRIVKPHPDFRIFLTVDPRYGELSRAMRNRAAEIYIEPHAFETPVWSGKIAVIEARQQRYKSAFEVMAYDSANNTRISQWAVDGLTLDDLALLSRHQSSDGLIAGDNTHATLFSANQFLKSIHTASRSSLLIDGQQILRDSYVASSDHDLHYAKNFLPLHPLHNSPIIPLLRECPLLNPVWLSICYEMSFIIADAWELLERQKATASNMQISSMNRLQRSLVAESVVAVQKDSTVRSAKFLVGLLQAVEAYLKTQLKNPIYHDQHKLVLRDIVHSWKRTFQCLTGTQFEEARFQALLSHMSACLHDHLISGHDDNTHQLLIHVISGFDECFVAGFKLTTGFGMEQLWDVLRPTPVQNMLMFNQLSHMERLASQLDEIKWKSGIGLFDLTKITSSFAQAYRFIRVGEANAEDLLQPLQSQIEQINQHLTDDIAADTPFLAREFDTIRQLVILNDMYQQTGHTPEVDELDVLSDTPMTTLLRIHSATDTSRPMQLMETFMRESRVSVKWDQTLSSDILHKLDIIDAAHLSRLVAVETELPLLAKHLSKNSQALTSNQARKLNKVLSRIMDDILAVYNPDLATIFDSSRVAWSNTPLNASVNLGTEGLSFKFEEVLPASITTHLHEPQGIVVKHFVSSLVSLMMHEQGQFNEFIYLANGWMQFSLALVKLFVPDKPFDPQLRPLAALNSYDQLFEALRSRLESLRQYEQFRHGEPTSVRIDIAEKDMRALGQRPTEMQVTYRPTSSELSKVQTEFNSILRVVHGSDLEAILFQHYFGSDSASQELEVIRENISRISLRLTHNHRAYEDMTIPTVHILHCLGIGLSLGQEAKSQSKASKVDHASLHEYIPFLGAKSKPSSPRPTASPFGLEFLMYAGLVRAIEGLEGIARIQQSIFEVVHTFYDQWHHKLEEDRKTEEAKSSWFRYRGADEETEEAEQAAFNDLFPKFNDESEAQEAKDVVKINNARALSIQVAELHKVIFLGSHNASSGLKNLVKHVARKICSVQGDRITDDNLLSATLLVLEERLDVVTATSVSNTYNFYTDPNRLEGRNLVSLVSDIRARFRQLQQIDEIGHMQPLVNVVSACDKILDLGYADSLAQIIPRVEQLHAFVYEWQFGGWAGKTCGVLPLYTRLTDMLVSWRRLELSTWNKLFDTEVKKCDDDAASWWFIAYQAVIVGPMALIQSGEDLRSHAVNLIKELEMYFASAPVGQFRGRLGLLEQLHVHLRFLLSEFPQLVVMRNSLRNFIDLYSRYNQPVKDLIQGGRTPIEKKMKDVLLLASWKDTNIVALRQSAQKSHQKLFQIVRKFRDVLNQPMKAIIDRGLSVATDHVTASSNLVLLSSPTNQAAIEECDKTIAGWTTDYKRLANVQRTVQIMTKLGQTSASNVDAASVIDDFLVDLNNQIAELRKETPPVLNDENADLVKHLKTRKRKLFAEVLRAVRHMGVPYNLALDALAKQDSLSTVFASTVSLVDYPLSDPMHTEYYFHQMLDLAPRIRSCATEHSEDLTSAEVTRSIGLFEGILNNSMGQRRELLAALADLKALETSCGLIRLLGQTQGKDDISPQLKVSNCQAASIWLLEILKVGIQMVELHGRFGSLDNHKVVELLSHWEEKLKVTIATLEALPELPPGLVFTRRLESEQDLIALFNQFKRDVHEVCQERPDLAFILEQVILWTAVDERDTKQLESFNQDISLLVQSVKRLCDSILVTVEQFSKAAAEIPASDEDAGWLTKHNQETTRALRVLRLAQIEKSLSETLHLSRQLDWTNSVTKLIVPSLLSVVTPIINQYQNICSQFIDKIANCHKLTCKLGFMVGRSFTQIASQGFCTPQEKSEEKAANSEKLEDGTGLGEGEGAEDISKDVQPDEDLSELAQEKNNDPNREMEDEKDAVDMADEDLEGDLNSVDGEDEDDKGSESENEDDKQEIEEQSGDVDDLDPTAVDEKMWDGENEDEAEKDQKGDKPKGQKKKDEEIAGGDDQADDDMQPENDGDQADEKDDEEAAEDQEEEVQHQDEQIPQDQNVQEQEALALPDDMAIDTVDNDSMSSISDDELDELSDVDHDEEKEKETNDDGSESGQENEMETVPAEENKEEDGQQSDDENDMTLEDAPRDEPVEEDHEDMAEEQNKPEQQVRYDNNSNPHDVAASDAKGGGGQDQDADHSDEQKDAQNGAEQEQGQETGQETTDAEQSQGQKGAMSQRQDGAKDTNPDDAMDTSFSQPFKALGDALEKWHKRQREIREAQENQTQQPNVEQDAKIQEFQHLEHDDAVADAQAMGTATEEQTQQTDDAMAIDEEEEPASNILPQETPEEHATDEDVDIAEAPDQHNTRDDQQEERQSGVTTHQGAYSRATTPPAKGAQQLADVEDPIEEASEQLVSTHLEPQSELRDFEESMQQWTALQSKTHPLSLSLTSQLRLILTPSQSTKLSGSFRTGKRLNIKRIIPYIASSYKRDKIWMRRAIPTKRAYQILLCVDDSSSMGEGKSGDLALESLVMVSRALSMLEVGQVGVLGFGQDVFMAHEFTEPFASHDSGAKVLQKFSFQQNETDIHLLVRQTIERFRIARQQSTSRGSEDLWQLALILSDGVTPSAEHESIRVLLREAIEERIMIVFIVMDDTAKKGKKESVLNLKKVKFLGNDEIQTEYYLDTFPFQYYLIVHNLEDLPGALSGLLRTWFAEINA